MKKKFLLIAILVMLSLVFGACTPKVEEATEAPEVEETEEVEAPSKYSQSPMLDDMGLPPVEERLPDEPFVLEVVDSIGEYGGTWQAVADSPGMATIKMKFYDPPVRWNADYSGYHLGLAESFEFNEDGTQLTYTLRPGLKWSDGAPYTTADWEFWWNDLATNEDYAVVSVPWWARNEDGTPFTIEFPDDYTIVMTWDTARWIAPYILAQGFWEWEPLMKPAHFLKQYHPDYEGDDYDGLQLNDKWWETPGYPTIFAWYCDEITPGERVTFVRNPYYWKVDTEGHQLPYIDYVSVEIQPDEEVRILNMSQGKYHASFRGTTDPRNIPFLQEQAADYEYHIQAGWMNGAGAWPGWLINQDYVGEECGDPIGSVDAEECRDLLRDQNFRKGLSHALDRERILNVVWDGIGYITQATISPQSWHFVDPEGQAVYEEWKNADIEYDPVLAEEYFDKAGFVDADGDGWRDLPSGSPFVLVMDLNDWGGEQVRIESDEIARESWEAVGVKMIINNVIGQPDGGTRGDYGLSMIRGAHISEIDLWTYPDWVFPIRGGGEGSRAFPMAGLWYSTGGEEGIKPEEGSPAARLQALYNQGISEPDEYKRHELVWEAIRINIEEGPFNLGATGDQPMPVVIGDDFHNVPEYGVLGPWAPGSPGNTNPEQYWIGQ
ncbi:MAG: ABC transporter substrate-binding protein [Chloroflexota bacterium]|nr:ABC transporter substrate-binding protein [Chloroflexota bacterium]